MPFALAPLGRATFLACLAALAVAGCGRRGPLEPPSASADVTAPRPTRSAEPGRPGSSPRAAGQVSSAPTAGGSIGARPAANIGRSGSLSSSPLAGLDDATGDEDPSDADDPAVGGFSAAPTPTARNRRRAYTVPKEPFFLDPLL
jgi:predicted small lipoprotein YifL